MDWNRGSSRDVAEETSKRAWTAANQHIGLIQKVLHQGGIPKDGGELSLICACLGTVLAECLLKQAKGELPNTLPEHEDMLRDMMNEMGSEAVRVAFVLDRLDRTAILDIEVVLKMGGAAKEDGVWTAQGATILTLSKMLTLANYQYGSEGTEPNTWSLKKL